MAGYNFGSPPKVNRMEFSKFKGVDFQTNPLEMNLGRSPNSMNMLIDKSGYPVKRTGYIDKGTGGNKVNGIYTLKTDDLDVTFVHLGSSLYIWDEDSEYDSLIPIMTNIINDDFSVAFQHDSKLFILDGHTYRCIYHDGTTFKATTLTNMATTFIPTTVISRNPDGTGGASFQPVNMVCYRRKNSFLGKADVKDYILDAVPSDASTVKAKKMTSNGVWTDLTITTDFTVNAAQKKVTFTVAPGVSPVTGMDNVIIEFERSNYDNLQKISKCTIFDIYTIGSGNYYFFSGNPEFGNMDFRSEINDPTYFPDTGYSIIGQESTDIMSYIKINNTQAILKEGNDQDSSIYLRNAVTDSNGKVSFPITSGIASSGCISKYATVNLNGDSLFLSKDGVNALTTTILGVNMCQSRSYYVDPHLLKQDLKNAKAIEFEGRYYLAVGGYVYVADSRFKEYNKYAGTESYQYEWTLWDNMPVRVWHKKNGNLYFGTETGGILRMQKDDGTNKAEFYTDENNYEMTSTPVRAYWDTPYIDFGTISRNKNMKGLWIVLKPNIRTSCNVYYKTRDAMALTPNYTADMIISNDTAFADIFDMDNIDFNRFSFITNDGPHVVATNRKEKKFNLMQLRLENKNAEPMGIYKVQIDYTISSKYKGK